MVYTPFIDCHAHVYERIYPVGQSVRYLPKDPAPADIWLSHLKNNGLKGGVIVQISFFKDDNSELLYALERLGKDHFRGIAVVDLDAKPELLWDLKNRGIKGVRWNLVSGAPRPDLETPQVLEFLSRLNSMGLHLQIQLEGPILGHYLRKLAAYVDRIVIDHFGLPRAELPKNEPWISALHDLSKDHDLWVKFSAPYRSPVEIGPYADIILDVLGPDRIVWGSDWPWTNHEQKHSYEDTLKWAELWLGQIDPKRTASANAKLYGFPQAV